MFPYPFMLIKIGTMLRLLGYPADFIETMVFATTALFFGTGNQTRNVPAAVVAKVFCDPDFAIFKLDEELFVGDAADFFAFTPLGQIYGAMQRGMADEGVEFRLGTPVERVERDNGGVRV